MVEKDQKLVLAILEFLETSMVDGSVCEDDKNGIEVAIQRIGKTFGVDLSDAAQRQKLSIHPENLQSLFDVYLKTKEKIPTLQTTGTSSSASKVTTGAPSNSSSPSAADKSQAEQLRLKGNTLMTSKDYAGAIAAYTSAIPLDPTNAVYYSNRAAAHSSTNNHKETVNDAQRAIEVDSNFVDAYYRLGHALYCLGDYQESATAFQRGLDLEPNNTNLRSGLETAQARIPSVSTPESTGSIPVNTERDALDINTRLESLERGGSGEVDLSTIMSMGLHLLQNGGLGNLMQNPALNGMMNGAQSGDISSIGALMNNPAIAEMLSKLGGGADGARPGSV